MTTESIKLKIAALLAKAEKTDNKFEADAFMAKVNELLEKYQFDIWEVRDAGADPLGHQRGEAAIFMSMPWGRDLVWTVARYFYCQAIFHSQVIKSRKQYTLVGRESCRITCELMLPFIITQIRLQSRVLMAADPYLGKSAAERYVANALITRINRLIVPRPHVEMDTGNAFDGKSVILTNEVEALIEELFPNINEAAKRKLESTKLARELAEKVSLNHQATSSGKTKLLT